MRRSYAIATMFSLVASTVSLVGLAPSASSASTARPAAATPYFGGTLDALANGEPDYLDPNVSYSSTGQLFARMISRQLYAYPAVKGQTTKVQPDLATAMPAISNGGKTYRITIRAGAKWNTTPARQVTAADLVRGVKTTCNPAHPFGGLPDFESLVKGMTAFCDKFGRRSSTAPSIANYVEHTPLPGARAISDRTVEFTLTHPASYFVEELTMPAFSARAVELDAYVPGTVEEAMHSVSDGPYELTSYQPSQSMTLDRNPAWSSATDPIRKAYVDAVHITEGHSQDAITNAIAQNNPKADVEFDLTLSTTRARTFRAHADPRLVTGPTYSSNPYIVFNTVSPSSGKALQSANVRRAISYALNRPALLKSFDGLAFGTALTHVLPRGIDGSRKFDDYPHSIAKAKRLLAQAGHPHPTLKLLYRDVSSTEGEIATAMQRQLGKAGITLKLLRAPGQFTIYTRYLENPHSAKNGDWDLSMAGWGPDWFGDAAASFFKPLFDGRSVPPFSSNYGLYDDPAVNSLIDRAERAGASNAAGLWAKADRRVMSDAAIYPLVEPDQLAFHGSQVHNFVLMPAFQQCDYTNVWLSPGASS